MAKKPKKWIQSADLKEGAFTNWCIKQGFKGVTEGCIMKGMKSEDATTRKRANLAATFKKMSKPKKNKKD